MFRYSIITRLVETIRAPRTRGVHALSGWRAGSPQDARHQVR